MLPFLCRVGTVVLGYIRVSSPNPAKDPLFITTGLPAMVHLLLHCIWYPGSNSPFLKLLAMGYPGG